MVLCCKRNTKCQGKRFSYIFLFEEKNNSCTPSGEPHTRRWLGPLAIAVPPRLAVLATFVEALAVVVTVAISHENGGAMEEREVEGGCFWDVFGMCFFW